MKMLDGYMLADLRASVLYEEDLREISSLLSKTCSNVKFTVENLQFDDLDELIQHFAPQRIKELKISASSPHTSIDLTSVYSKIYVGSNTPAAIGLFHECKKIIERRSRIYSILSAYSVFYLFVALDAIFSFLISRAYIDRIWALYLMVIFVPYSGWFLYLRTKRYSLIFSRKVDTLEAFWLRNKDKLLVEMVIGFFGLIFGIILQRFF